MSKLRVTSNNLGIFSAVLDQTLPETKPEHRIARAEELATAMFGSSLPGRRQLDILRLIVQHVNAIYVSEDVENFKEKEYANKR